MSAPKNPIVRGLLAAGTMGLSEVPAQFGAVASAVQGKDPLKSYTKGKSPMEAIAPELPKPPGMEEMSAFGMNTAEAGLAMSPSASIRSRRNFSTLLTSPQGVMEDTSNIAKKSLLGGSGGMLGK